MSEPNERANRNRTNGSKGADANPVYTVKHSGQRLLKEGLGRLVGAAFAVTPTSAEGFGGAREYGLRCARSRVRTGERKGDVSGH